MNLSKIINDSATAKRVMQQQAGNRFIVTITMTDKDGNMSRVTTHYKDYAEVDYDLVKYEKRGYEVTWASDRADELLATK